MKRFLLRLWIFHKVRQGRRKKWIGSLGNELRLVASKSAEEIRSLRYIPDRNRLGNPWDYQGDAVETFRRGGGDCNWLNRVNQVALSVSRFDAYLVTWIHRPVKMEIVRKHFQITNPIETAFYWVLSRLGIALAHTTVIYRDASLAWFSYDYGQPEGPYLTADLAIRTLAAEKYEVEPVAYVVQGLDWKEVEL